MRRRKNFYILIKTLPVGIFIDRIGKIPVYICFVRDILIREGCRNRFAFGRKREYILIVNGVKRLDTKTVPAQN